jgi:hypothetical protein
MVVIAALGFPLGGMFVTVISFVSAVDDGRGMMIIPGVLLAAVLASIWQVSVPACVAECHGVVASLSRSRILTTGCRWRAFGTSLVVLIATLAVVMATVVAVRYRLHVRPSGEVLAMSMVAFCNVIGGLCTVLNGVLFYELRVARKGVDNIGRVASVFD